MSGLLEGVLEGGCNCGAVRYVLAPGFRLGPYACHCTGCQTRTGSAFAEYMMVERAALDAPKAERAGETINPSGARSVLYGCLLCGARLWGENDQRPDMATLRCGTLDRGRETIPRAHIWVSSKQDWIALPGGVRTLDTQPQGPSEWFALFAEVP